MKGYKAFKKGMICNGKQYEENKIFEEPEAVMCEKGIHFCKYPFDVLNYYDLIDENGDFLELAEVEALEEPLFDGKDKYCTKKIKIGAKLKFKDFIELGINFIINKTKDNTNSARIGSSGNSAWIGSSGNRAQIGSSGNYSQIGSSGNYARIGSSGNCARIGSSGNYSQIGSSGNCARIGSSGNCARIGSSGDYAQIGSSGNCARIGSSGNYAQIGSSGNCAQIGSSGDDCVICCAGNNSKVKAKKGSWITLSEWKYDVEKQRNIPICVKTEYVDGEKIKEDTFYILKNGEFKEVK